MTEMLFWIGACGLALAVGAPLVYLALFDPPLEKKFLLVAASACSALILALYVKPDLADRLILGTLQVDQAVETARPVRHLDFEHRKTDDGYEYRLPGEDWKPVMAVEYIPGLEEIQLSVDYRGATLLLPEEETQ